MPDDSRHSSRRRTPVQVEPLESRALLSAVTAPTPVSPIRPTATSPITASATVSEVGATTSVSAGRRSKPQAQTEVVVTSSSGSVNQQESAFTVTLSLKKGIINGLTGAQPAAALDVPLTVDFSASLQRTVGGITEAASPIFAPFHESVAFPPGVSIETITVPIISSVATPGPVPIYLSAASAPSSLGVPTEGAPTEILSGPGASGVVELYSSPDSAPPSITSVQLVTQGKLASAVVLSFSKAMTAATVNNIQNYRILSRPKRTSQKGFLFWRASTTTEIQSFPIAAANYDPSTSTVTLTLKRPARASSLYEVSSAYPLKGHELTDTGGRPLASPSTYSFVMVGGFTNLIHPIPRVTPSLVGALRTTRRTDSLVSKLNPLRGFA